MSVVDRGGELDTRPSHVQETVSLDNESAAG